MLLTNDSLAIRSMFEEMKILSAGGARFIHIRDCVHFKRFCRNRETETETTRCFGKNDIIHQIFCARSSTQ